MPINNVIMEYDNKSCDDSREPSVIVFDMQHPPVIFLSQFDIEKIGIN